MVQLFIKYTDDNYYLLDLDTDENINYKVTAKDLSDITKVFSPFTQSFSLPATDKNKRLCGFVGNEKIQRINNDGIFDCLVYVGGFIFDAGKLSFDESDYELQDQKNFKTSYSSNLTGLAETLGDLTIQDIFRDENGVYDDALKIGWGQNTLANLIQGIRVKTMTNGNSLKYGIPLIATDRVWEYDQGNLNIVNNVAYNPNVRPDNRILYKEMRPSISYMTIMNELILKLGLNVNCPLFTNPELRDLYVWCSSEKIVDEKETAKKLIDYDASSLVRNVIENNTQSTGPLTPRWVLTDADVNGVFKITRTGTSTYWDNGFDLKLTFNNLVSLDGIDKKIQVTLRKLDGTVINSQEVDGVYQFRIIDGVDAGFGTHLDNNGELYFYFEILPLNLVSFDSVTVNVIQRYKLNNFGTFLKLNILFTHTIENAATGAFFGGNFLNLVSALPKMKCTDFLKSFFKTFNISVITTGKQDQSMYWVTDENIAENNKEYSKRIVDYTQYTDISSLNKKRANEYNQYIFKHAKSKYFDSVYGNGTRLGELKYPEITPTKATKFEVQTKYSIIKQNSIFAHPSARICLGFENSEPEILPDLTNKYTPVYDEFTLMYLSSKSLGAETIGVEFNGSTTTEIFNVLEANYAHFNGKTLTFGTEDVYTSSLYLNYYKTLIEHLLRPNAYKSEFTLILPANEIFLNFANTNQGESNMPTGFRPQNEVVIGEQRYKILDTKIEMKTGKTKLTLLNF